MSKMNVERNKVIFMLNQTKGENHRSYHQLAITYGVNDTRIRQIIKTEMKRREIDGFIFILTF
jgi:DNA-directed RNA polymerase sigma subunit (sigma70/sigma32)